MPIAVAQSPSKLAVALPAILADRGNVSAPDMRRHPIGTGRSNSSSTNPTNRSRWRELGLREAGAALFGVWRWQWPTVAVVLVPSALARWCPRQGGLSPLTRAASLE